MLLEVTKQDAQQVIHCRNFLWIRGLSPACRKMERKDYRLGGSAKLQLPSSL